MKKLIMMAATLIMCFAFSLSVMAAPSPEDEYDRESPEQTNVDKKSTSASPKTSDQGAPVTLVYVSLAAAALAVYAAKHVKEQY